MSSNPGSLDQLLARTDWLRRLARGLLDDPHAADDAVQEVMVAAIQQPPERVENWSAWLARVLRRTIVSTRRSNRRRRCRELGSASGYVAPDTAEIVAQAAMQRAIVDYVLELEEPYRSTLLLRFFEDLRPRQVASRLGVPIDTVYSRLHRGLALLRGRLDGARGEHRAWRAALLPFAGTHFAWQTSLIGVVSMSLQSKFALCAGCVLLAALLWNWPFGDLPNAPAEMDGGLPPTEHVATAGGVQPGDRDSPAVRELSRRIAAGPVQSSFVVRGIVRSYAGGKALGGRRVRAAMHIGYGVAGEPVHMQTVTSDAAGRFAWAPPKPTRTVTLQFTSANPEVWSGYGQTRWIRSDQAPSEVVVRGQLLDLRLVGRVLDDHGQPLAGALVWSPYTGLRRITGEDGCFEIPTSGITSSASLYCRRDGFVLAQIEVATKTETGELECEFRLQPSVTYRGRTVDVSGQPIAGVAMRTGHVFGKLGQTDDAGRFVLGSMDPTKASQLVWFTHPNFKPLRQRMSRAAADREITVTMHRGVQVEGRVFDHRGRPVAGVEVRVRPDGSAGDWGVSNDEGIFVVRNAATGTVLLEAKPKGYVTFQKTFEVPANSGPLQGVDVHLQPERVLVGRLVDAQRQPVTQGGAAAFQAGRYLQGGRVDQAGRFRIEGLSAGSVRLEAYAAGYLRRNISAVAVPQNDFEVVLQRAASLAGRVLDASSGAPIERFRVRFVSAFLAAGDVDAGSYAATWADPGNEFRSKDGRWTTAQVGGDGFRPGGCLGVEITAKGYAPFLDRRARVSVDPDPAAFTCRLRKAGQIRGRVVARVDGVPIAAATVRLTTADRPLHMVHGWREANAITAQTDSDGRFELTEAPVGETSLRIEHREHAWMLDGPFLLRSGESVDRLVRMPAGVRLTGTASPDTTVLLRTLTGGLAPDLLLVTKSDAGGKFRFRQALAPGRYAVCSWRRRSGYIQWLQAEVRVMRLPVAIALRPGSGSAPAQRSGLRCQLTQPGSIARLRPAGGGPWIELPAEDSKLEVRGLPPGEWQVHRVGRFRVEPGKIAEPR